MQSEVTVVLKNEDSTFRKKFICYDKFAVDFQDPVICNFIQQAKAEYTGTPDEVWLKISAFMGS